MVPYLLMAPLLLLMLVGIVSLVYSFVKEVGIWVLVPIVIAILFVIGIEMRKGL